MSMVVWTRGDNDDDDGGNGDRKLAGSNGSSCACVGGTGCTTTTGSPTFIAGRSLWRSSTIAVNKALKISIISLHSSTSCHLLWQISSVVQSLAQNYLRRLRTSSPTATRDFPVNHMAFAKKTLGGDWPFCYNSLECPFGQHFYCILS